ncbi:MAG: aminotransferase class I/II-fold pyridoxal phosphate-dependent enzyme [Micropruina sp.]
MNSRIHLSPPDVGQLEEEAVVRAVRSGWVAPLGPEVDVFEDELARFCGRRHAVALSSGTAALHLGLLTLGVKPGDAVVTATMTFAATANAIVYAGAEPIFVDCDESGNLNPELTERALAELTAAGRRVGALVPVDLLGKVADHEALAEIAARYQVPVLSDAAESLGATRAGRPAAAYGVAAALSFNGNKVMTTSGGGALLTDDAEFAGRVRYLATQARQPFVHYEHTEIGYNYRLSNVLAALGRAQLERLPGMIERRRSNRLFYAELIADVRGVSLFAEPSGLSGGPTSDNWWLTAILVDQAEAGVSRDQIRDALAAQNIEARPLWKPMHAQPVFAGATAILDGTSDGLFVRGLSLPSGSGLRAEERDRIAATLTGILGSPRR